jgi:hypothetical protein
MKCLADHVVPHPYDELTIRSTIASFLSQPAAGSAYPMEDQHLNRAGRPKTLSRKSATAFGP